MEAKPQEQGQVQQLTQENLAKLVCVALSIKSLPSVLIDIYHIGERDGDAERHRSSERDTSYSAHKSADGISHTPSQRKTQSQNAPKCTYKASSYRSEKASLYKTFNLVPN
jgi:hypothetical protein